MNKLDDIKIRKGESYFMTGLCSYARISKSKIRYILSTFNTKAIKVNNVNNKDISKCLNCDLKQNNSSFDFNFSKNENTKKCIDNYCLNYCTKSDNDFEEFYFAYETELCYGKAEIITDSFKSFSINKSAIKQYLLYHFIPGNKNWLKIGVSFSAIARLCNLSLPTVKKNHKLLVEAGLIYSTYLGNGKFNFIITDEYKNHFSKKRGGSGYITLSYDSLKHLISFNSVNELRVELVKFLWVDARTGSLGKNIKFKKENLIENLPFYIQKSNKKTDEIINSKNSLFGCSNNKLNTSKYETSSKILRRLREEAVDVISDLFKDNDNLFSVNCCKLLSQLKSCNPHLYFIKDDLENKIKLEKKAIIKNLANLAVQYGIAKVTSAINYMLSDAHIELDSDLNMKKTDIKNPGAFIRVLIVNSINNNGSLENNVA